MQRPKIEVRQHTLAPQYGLDRVKLTKIQHGPLGGINRTDGERLSLLWNLTRNMTDEEIEQRLTQ